ncbi:unnamed protein product [Ixodes persulcatus]
MELQSEMAVVGFLQLFIYKLCFYVRQHICLVIFGVFATFLSLPGNNLLRLHDHDSLQYTHVFLEFGCTLVQNTACFLAVCNSMQNHHVLTFITAHRCLRQFAHPVKTVFLHIAMQGANFVAINDSSCFGVSHHHYPRTRWHCLSKTTQCCH